MNRSVGLEVLQHLLEIKQTITDFSDGEHVTGHIGIYINGENSYEMTYDKALPLIHSFEEAGWVEKEVDRSYRVRRTYTHSDLHDLVHVNITHKATDQDKLKGLLDQQAKLQEEIEKYKKGDGK
jgi:hypothetical protein